ncbi:PAS domain-containing sensor histidine kinase [Flaviaesturariibacter amylovorans]|uniref:PAS domain-containing sensor histidine kinase n=1 Tax=Flaviaesturariibacter amylovorans TaxID=1084520 RepID=UPI0031E6229F
MNHLRTSPVPSFLQGGGEMGALTRSYDWAATPLGPPDAWPQSLRTTLGILLHSRFPMCLFWGADLTFFYNDAFRPSLGADGKHPGALGQRGATVWPEVWPDVYPQIEGILTQGIATWHEDQLLPIYRNGALEDVYWTYSYSPVFDESGKPRGVFVTCVETTKTVSLIQELQLTNEKARLAIESADLGVVEVDLLTEDVRISHRIEELFGLPSGSARGAFLERMHPDDVLLRQAAYERASASGKLEYESRVYHPQGPERWIRLKGSLTFDDAGTPQRMIAVVQDITAQKAFSAELSRQVRARTRELEETHERLLTSNRYLQQIINIFNSPLQVLQPVWEGGDVVDFTYQLTNEAYAAYAGVSPAQLEGRRVSEFFPGYFGTDTFRNIREVALSGKEQIWQNHYSADGLDIYNEMGAVLLNGNVVVHLNDYTGLKRLQLELERRIEELKRSNDRLEEFAHAASHDLKEPIRKIHYFTAQLKDGLADGLDDAQRRAFERVEKAAKRMGSLIDDLLQYSHVSQRAPEPEEVDLAQTVARVLDDLELDITQKGARVEVGPLPVLQGHRRQLQQLFQNLVSNALKYSRPGTAPEVRISATMTEENGQRWHLLSVADNGIGFPEEYKDKIFGMFVRLHGLNEYAGTGVGLSIVRKVAENHGGCIRAHSTEGAGATFELLLPVGDR